MRIDGYCSTCNESVSPSRGGCLCDRRMTFEDELRSWEYLGLIELSAFMEQLENDDLGD